MSGPFTFTTEIIRESVSFEVEVQYTCTPFIAATHWQPAEGGEIEVASVKWGTAELSGLTDAEEAAIEAECREHAGQDMQDDTDEAADYRADQADDRRMREGWERRT